MLLQLLHEEAITVSLQVHLVSENKLTRVERKKYHKIQADIFKVWDELLMEIKQQINF